MTTFGLALGRALGDFGRTGSFGFFHRVTTDTFANALESELPRAREPRRGEFALAAVIIGPRV